MSVDKGEQGYLAKKPPVEMWNETNKNKDYIKEEYADILFILHTYSHLWNLWVEYTGSIGTIVEICSVFTVYIWMNNRLHQILL